MQIGWIIVLAVIALAAILFGFYTWKNMHPVSARYHEIAVQAGYVEKDVSLPDGTTIHYGEGPNNGPALLLIHGQGGDWTHYGETLPELAKKYHVYSIDCYGHGGSTHNPALYNCVVNSKALVWFLKNEIKEAAFLSGHSSGGIMAAWIAANAPEMTKGFVIEDSPFFEVTPQEMTEGAGGAAWFDSFLLRHNYLNQTQEPEFAVYYIQNSYFMKFFGELRKPMEKAVRQYRAEHPDEPVHIFWLPGMITEGMYLKDFDMRFSDTFYTGSWFDGMDQAETLSKIQCPTVYIKALVRYGEDGVLYAANSDEDAQRVMDLIADCQMVTIKSGHNIHCEYPAFFVKAFDYLPKDGR